MGLMDQPSFHTPKERPREVTWSTPHPPTPGEKFLRYYHSILVFIKTHRIPLVLGLLTILLLRAIYIAVTDPEGTFKIINPDQSTLTSPTPSDPSSDPNSPTPTSVSSNSQQLDNQLGGYRFQYPPPLVLKPASDYYAAFHPTFYDPTYYFDCINKQLGQVLTRPCWLIELQVTIDEPIEPTSNHNLDRSFTDTSGRQWSISGPIIDGDYSLLYATLNSNQINYRFDTRVPLESLKNHLNSSSASNTDLINAHLNLANNLMSSFVNYRKPILQEPSWIFKLLDTHWQISHPQNWQVFQTGGEINLPAGSHQLLGEYGMYPLASFHDYSLQLDTISDQNLPESARTSLTAWVNYELSLLNSQERSQVIISDIQVGNLSAKKVLRIPEITYQYLQPRIKRGATTHKIYISNSPAHPFRSLTIQQLDRQPNFRHLEMLLDLFVSKII